MIVYICDKKLIGIIIMTESLVNEWLADCADHSPAELHTFANTLSQDHEIIRALFTLLEERSKYSEVNINY